MDRKKPPALTSPWKVGFLVALMLVVAGLGVSYFITGTFGVTWHWITVDGPSPTQWSFNFSAFAEEMLPLIGLISILAFASSVLVSGAVRRYKTYVDSGAEYKDLLRSIKGLEDLEDEDKLDQLKQHPELREFLMGLKRRLAARESQTPDRERRHAEPSAAPARFETLASEAAVLVGAITAGADGLARELSLSIPELKQIERAVRQRVASHVPQTPAPTAPAAPVRDEKAEAQRRDLESRLGSVRAAVAAMRRDADACSAGARELEAAVAAVKQSVAGGTAAGLPAEEIAALAKRVDVLADALSTLGEETKRIAIASAMQASGGADDDSIRVADEVRAIATRFNTVAQQWKDGAPALRRALESASGSATANERQRAGVSKSVLAVASKTSLWSERMVVLAEQVRGLERIAGGDSAVAAPEEGPREWGAVDIGAASEPRSRAAQPMRPAEAPADNDDFQTQSAASVFADTAGEDAPFVDIPGFEKEHKIFDEPAHQTEPDRDGRFVVDGNKVEGWDSHAAKPSEPVAEAVAEAERGSKHEPAGEDSEGFLTGPRATLGTKKKKGAARPAPAEVVAPAAAPARETVATIESDPDATDLYALGALDFDERVHA